jgi:serine/threonine protein kinase
VSSRGLPPCPYCGHDHADTVLKCPKTDMVLPLQGRLLEDKFRLLRKLGKGGMASVWLATNIRVDREVAIKLIRPEVLRNEELVARFRSEAKAAGRIDHPNVCDILDFGIGPVGPYIVMEYLRGRTLAQMIKRGGPMPVAMAAKLVRQALAGLMSAHANGIVHRDLKPENVFLHETPGGEPVVKIMDFGVAKFTDGSNEITTEQGALLGTPEYMAPEQFLGADMAEPRTDLWAVGAILYRALTGEHAFKGPTVAATLMRVTHDEPSPLRSLAPDVPEAVEAIVRTCLAKKPEDRYESARVLRSALQPFEDETGGQAGASSLRLLLDRVMAAPDDDDSPEQRATPSPSLRSRDTPLSALPKPDALPDPELAPAAPAKERRLPAMLLPIAKEPAESDAPTKREKLPQKGGGGRGLIAVLLLGALAGAAWLWTEAERAAEDEEETEVAVRGQGGVRSRVENGAIEEDPAEAKHDAGAGVEIAVVDIGGAEAIRIDVGTLDADEIEEAVEIEEAAEDAEAVPDPDPDPVSAPIPSPPTVPFDKFVFAKEVGRRSTHTDARRYCEALALTRHGGYAGWKLPFPSLVRKLIESGAAPPGKYWTSARWHNRAKIFLLPSGKMISSHAERKNARALCIASIPRPPA